ncbi:exosome complex exonuclease RRP46-like [Citrus sinensis]|uniref:Exosome complex exonuclease RRP46-like n=1 Tax=Citrus sinensis TaxID=2711 RepID=A0ACB8NP29_CITSI|nr:exosome complex exonuclease RRP46-like [Citrus sinensis]
MEIDRADGRNPNQLRPLACYCSILHRAHGSARDTKVLAAVYGPKAGTERRMKILRRLALKSFGNLKLDRLLNLQNCPFILGKQEKEYEMILKRTLQSICILTINPNTTTSVIIQVW